jgi:putative DNA primase/helicase
MTAPHNGAAGRAPIDFASLAQTLLGRAQSLLEEWFPGGRREGHEWSGPRRRDGGVGNSLKVNLHTGQADAARELMRDLGIAGAAVHAPPAAPAAAPATATQRVQAQAAAQGVDEPPRERWRSIVPVPGFVREPQVFRWGFRDATAGDAWREIEAARVWTYRRDDALFGYVCRFERIDSSGELVKDLLPYTWCQDTQDPDQGCSWRWRQWAAPRPLYLPRGTLRTDDAARPVLIVEGEKCADAAQAALDAAVGGPDSPDAWDVVAWPGGGKAWPLAAWQWIAHRALVVLWPDADAQREPLTRAEREAGFDPGTKPIMAPERQPGIKAMRGIAAHLLQQVSAADVRICDIGNPGERADGWDVADALGADGWTPAQVLGFLRAALPFSLPVEAEAARAAAGADGRSTPSTAGASGGGGRGAGGGRPSADAAEAAPVGWWDALLRSKQGPLPVRENVVLALDGVTLPDGERIDGIEGVSGLVRFNDFTNDVLKLRATPWGTAAGVWDEVDELELGAWLTRAHGLPSMPRGTLEEAVQMVAKRHRFHPVRQSFEALRGAWDGEKRLATWLRRCCLEEDEWDDTDPLQRYLARVGTWVLMAIVARVFTPGCKFDYMLILEGGQGVGKSTLARLLGGDYFADTGLVLGDKDSYQNLQGVSVYEWGELDSLSKAEVTKVKQFISSAKDRFRASFDRRPKDYPRQVVFVGTTNEDHYLVDPTGNRRMWPVRVTRQIDLEWFAANRGQLFAEAVAAVDAGQRFHPTALEQRELFEPQQQQRQIESAIQAAALRYLYDENQRVTPSGDNGTLVQEITAPDLLGRLGVSVDKQTHVLLRQVTAALRHAGWVRFRSSRGDRPWMFRRPANARALGPQAGASGTSGEDERRTHGTDSEVVTDDCPF